MGAISGALPSGSSRIVADKERDRTHCSIVGGTHMYSWIVFAHVVAVLVFLLAHGVATVVTFKVRGERNVERIRALLDLSRATRAITTVSMLVMLAAGVIAGFMGNWWMYGWIWLSLGLLVVIGMSMTFLGSRSFDRIRQLVQPEMTPSRVKQKSKPSPVASPDQQLADVVAATHPWLLTILGGGGLVVILWLMMFKPF
jgi:hypothetical protein